MGSAGGHEDGKDSVAFSVFAETSPGSSLLVVGSVPGLGDWCPEHGLRLTTSPGAYPRWSVSSKLPSDIDTPESVEYKFIIVKPDGSVVWEDRPNRCLRLDKRWACLERTPWFGEEDRPPSGDGPTPVSPKAGSKNASSPKAEEEHFSSPVPSEEHFSTPQEAADTKDAEDPTVVRALSEQGPKASSRTADIPSRKLSVKAAEAPEGDVSLHAQLSHKRCPSLPNLGMLVQSSSFGRQQTPEAGAQMLNISFPDISDAEAEQMVVEVVFGAGDEPPSTHRLEYNALKQRWVLDFADTELPAGLHLFHFLLNGVHALSRNHPTYGHFNAALFSDPVRRYILARNAKQAARDTIKPKLAFNSLSPVKNLGGRSHSIGVNLAAMGGYSDESDEGEDDTISGAPVVAPQGTDSFPDEVFSGLYDTELRLRLHGFTLPEVPKPPGERNMVLKYGAYQLPKKYGSGRSEDAYFAADRALGVADGVGCMVQFASYGVNAADYAADLMEHAKLSLQPGGCASKDKLVCSVEERAQAACDAGEHGAQAYGASTMIVTCLDGDHIGVANLGDSGFMLLRKGHNGMQTILKSDEQQHSWNCPYQLTRLPPALARRFPKLDQDNASDCNIYRHEVLEGDLILMFSDGLRDNIHDHEILSIVDRALSPAFADLMDFPLHATDPEIISKALVLAAQHRSMDPHAKVPFTLYSRRHGYDCPGGKDDDITVVAAWVVPDGGSTIPALIG